MEQARKLSQRIMAFFNDLDACTPPSIGDMKNVLWEFAGLAKSFEDGQFSPESESEVETFKAALQQKETKNKDLQATLEQASEEINRIKQYHSNEDAQLRGILAKKESDLSAACEELKRLNFDFMHAQTLLGEKSDEVEKLKRKLNPPRHSEIEEKILMFICIARPAFGPNSTEIAEYLQITNTKAEVCLDDLENAGLIKKTGFLMGSAWDATADGKRYLVHHGLDL